MDPPGIPEKSFLGAEDLNGGGGMLGEIHERTGVGDESSADQFTHQNRQVRGDGHHTVLNVVVQLSSETNKRHQI